CHERKTYLKPPLNQHGTARPVADRFCTVEAITTWVSPLACRILRRCYNRPLSWPTIGNNISATSPDDGHPAVVVADTSAVGQTRNNFAGRARVCLSPKADLTIKRAACADRA